MPGKGLTKEEFEKGIKEIGYKDRAQVGEEYRDKYRTEAINGLCLKTGQSAPKSDLEGHSLVELARGALTAANQDDGGNPLPMLGRAETTSDFPLILAAVVNKSLEEGFKKADESWSQWCGTGIVNDFKPNSLHQVSGIGDLDMVPESTEYKYGSLSETKETFSIATYGKLLAITRQAIINDDLSALSNIPEAHGETVARKIGDLAYSVLTSNDIMGDGKALFHANHGNIVTASAPGVASIANGIKMMGTQKDIDGKGRLNIRPVFFIAPLALEGASEVFFRSERFDDTAKDATTINPYSGTYFQRIYESRLDDNSATAWYLAGRQGKTVKLFFLNGVQKPYVEQKHGWSVDGVEFKVRIDVAAKAIDWRGLSRNAGA